MEENDEKIRIERILGISVTSNAHFDCDSGLIAYPAGNTVVLLDAGSGTVVSHILLETRKPLSALQLKNNSLLFVASEDSNFLRVINWQSGLVKDISPCQNVICAAVSTLLGVLVTVGSDRVVSVWDYKSLISTSGAPSRNSNSSNASTPTGINNTSRGRKLASSSVACKVSCVYFSPDGNYFVTGGTRHLKFWYLQCGKNECVLTGRPAILGSEHSNADFRDVLTDGVATYAIANFDGTASSTLCQFDERRFLDKWVQLKTKQAMCMTMDDDLLFIGCAEGLIRCFRSGRLDFVATLPLPHHLGVDIAKATDVTALSSHPPVSKFPNVVAIGAPGGKKVVAVYADHSMYVWDVQDIKRVGLSHSWLWHSGCIWDIAVGKPAGRSNSLASGSSGGGIPSSISSTAGNGSFYNWPAFVTCSIDDTIRTWDITSQTKANLYSNECVDIKYISTRYLDSPPFISHGNGVRCVGIGMNFVCCGDRQGNLRLCRNKTKNELIKIKAHKEEVLSMDVRGTLVATASRDGTVNLYNVNEEIEKIASLTEHTGTVTSVKFLFSDRATPPGLQIISCGADKNLVFRTLVMVKKGAGGEEMSEASLLKAATHMDFSGSVEVQVNSVVTSKTPLFDLEADSSGKHVLVACQDACVRVYNVSSGKHSKTLRNVNNTGSPGTVIKVAVDPSGYFVATASTDKTITIFDYYKGDVVDTLLGHSELATALRFTPDFQNLVSVGGDSCIFVWTLPREMVVTMEARVSEKKSRSAKQLHSASPVPPPQNVSAPTTNPSSPVRADYRFSFGQLPDWAKKQIKGESGPAGVPDKSKKPPAPLPLPKGKWSERVEQASGAMTIKSFYNSDTVVPVPFAKNHSKDNLESRVGGGGGGGGDETNNYTSIESTVFNNKVETITHNLPQEDNNNIGNSRDNSFETCDESLKEILRDVEGDDEESTDFYSDVNKSTDGEGQDVPRIHLTRPSRSDTDTDESSSNRASKSVNKPVAAFREVSSSGPHPFDVVRSRNAELILSVKAKNREISKSRLELEKRLEETRKKLQSIGYKSMSQSTHDLSRSYGKVFSLSTLILLNRTKPVIKQPPLYTCPNNNNLQLSTQQASTAQVDDGDDDDDRTEIDAPDHIVDIDDDDDDENDPGQTCSVRPIIKPHNNNNHKTCCESTSSPSSLSSLSPTTTTATYPSFHHSMTDCSSCSSSSYYSNTTPSCSFSSAATRCQTNKNNNCSTYRRCTAVVAAAAASAKFSMRKHKIVQTVLPSRFHIAQLEYLDDSDDDNEDDDNDSGGRDGIRRACSLSDLNQILPNSSSITSSNNGTNGPSGRRKRSFHRHRNEKSRNGTTGVFDPQNLLTRSTSVTTLMHHAPSDSEPESLPVTPSYMSKTISSQGKTRRKPPTVVSAYSQENLRDQDDGRLRVSASEQNLSKIASTKINTPVPRSKMNTPSLKKPQQVAGIGQKGLAVVTGVRQGDGDEAPLNLNVASSSVDALRKSLDHVLNLRNRVSVENIPEDAPITRILDEGIRSVQRTLHESVLFHEGNQRPKIITEHDPTYV